MSSIARSAVKASSQSAKKRRSASVQSARKAPIVEATPYRGRHKRRVSEPDLSFMLEEDEEEYEEKSVSSEESTMTVAQLQEELRKLGAKISGRKQELIDRLRDARQGKIQRFGRYDVVITPSDMESKASDDSFGRPVVYKATEKAPEKEQPSGPPTTTTTTTTTVISTSSSSAASKSGGSGEGKPGSGPSSGTGGPKDPASGPSPSPLPSAVTVIGSPAPGAAAVDNRTIRVQYPGKPVETIKFDMNDKFVVENVSAMLRNLFPDMKVNLDPKLDIEPIYLMDEYAELHVVTLDFLRNCPTANDPPSTIYQARKGPIPLTVDDAALKRYQLVLTVLLTVLQVVGASILFSPSFVFGNMPQIGSFGLFRALHDWAGFGYPASLVGAMLHTMAFLITCSYMAPAYRLGIKVWLPRYKAFRVDAHKTWVRFKQAFKKRRQSLTARVFGYGSPITARLGFGTRANWMWLVTKRFVTSDLIRRVREFLAEGTVVSLLCVQLRFSVETTILLLLASFIRPKWNTMRLLWQGELNAEQVLGEMLFQSMAVPGFETNLLATPIVGSPLSVALVGKDDTKLKIKWAPPNDVPRVSTASERTYSVGVARYVVIANDGYSSSTFGCPAPARDWMRMPAIPELILGITFAVQSLVIHPGLGTFVLSSVLYSLFTASDAPLKGTSLTLENLTPDTEYTVIVFAVDDLNRKGAPSAPARFKTRPKTLFRRLLLASEEISLPAKPAAAPATAPPSVSVSVGGAGATAPVTGPTVTVVGGQPQTVSVVTGKDAVPAPPTAVAVAFATPPPPPPPAPSATRGHIRYAGVVWNMAMDERETELFLRTMRSAMLPDPRKEKFEADFVFSTESKTTHQVVSASYLRTLASSTFDPNNIWAWYKDPLLVAHPAGTRHTFAPGSIYAHMIASPKTVDRFVGLFVLGSLLSLAYSFTEAQRAGMTGEFWARTYIDAVRTLVQMFVVSNVMVMGLQRLRDGYRGLANPIQQRITGVCRDATNAALDLVEPDRNRVVLRSTVLAIVAILLCLFTLMVNGPLSFTGLFFCAVILSLANTALDEQSRRVLGEEIQVATNQFVGPAVGRIPLFVPRAIIRLSLAGIVAAILFALVPNNLIAALVAYASFSLIRFALQHI